MSTTEESDWEASGPGIRSQSEPPLPGPEPPVPELTGVAAPLGRSLSPPKVQNGAHSGFIRTLTSAGIIGGKAIAARPAVPGMVSSAGPRPYPAPFGPPSNPGNGNDEGTTSPDLTLSQMIASQDANATPSQLAFMARVGGTGSRGQTSRAGRGSRGGRPPKIKIEPPQEDGDSATPRKNKGGRPRGSRAGQSSALSTRPVNRGGRPRGSKAGMSATTGRGSARGGPNGIKRKRKSIGEGEDDEDVDTDSSEEITSLPTQSRSGRRITQVVTPVPFGAPESDSSMRPPKPPSFAVPSDLASSGQKPAKRKRVTLSAVCKNCGRGHSPQSNQIVFCDGCNTPWHQYCHDRPITPTVIQEEEKEWHCGDCEVHAEEAGYMVGRIPPAEGMGLADKRRALEGMERAELVALLLRASTLHPELPILKPPPPPETWTAALAATTVQAPAVKAEAEYEYYDEPLPYPRAGNGVRLPPEEDDVAFLIDENVTTYSHSWVRGESWVGGLADVDAHANILTPANFAIDVRA